MPGEVIFRARVNASCKQLNKGYNLSGIIQSSGRYLAFAVCHWVWEVWLSMSLSLGQHPSFCVTVRERTAALNDLPVKTAKTGAVGSVKSEECVEWGVSMSLSLSSFHRATLWVQITTLPPLFSSSGQLKSQCQDSKWSLVSLEDQCMGGYGELYGSWDLPVKYCKFWDLSSKVSLTFFSTNLPGSWICHFGAGYTQARV